MKKLLPVLVTVAALTSIASSAAVERHLTPLPANADAVAAKINAKLTPGAARWTTMEATRLHKGVIAPSQLLGDARNAGAATSGADISELCFVVLMQATRDQDEDLETIMGATKAETTKGRDLRAVEHDLQSRLDAVNEMSEAASMRLQMAMDRRSKFVETLSNILKKIEQTDNSILQNMK